MNDTALVAPPEFVPGIHRGMPFEQYLSTPALSASGAKQILRSPAHFRYAQEHPFEPGIPMKVGSAVHCGVLESEHFEARIACEPKCDKRTKVGKEIAESFAASSVGKLVLAADDYDRALGTVYAVRAHPAASALLASAESEVSMFWRCERWGINRKARMDTTRDGVITDLKTCRDASPAAFAKDAAKFGYHVQAAQYVDGYRATHGADPEAYLFIAAESEEPHGVAVYSLPFEAIDAGRRLLDTACERYRDCTEAGLWPSYARTIEPLVMPAWALKGSL